MGSFVNREPALKSIDDAFETLQDKKRLLRTPIMNFYGVKGIGKTLFLKKVQQLCQDKQLRCIWLDGSQSIPNCAHTIARQVQQSGVTLLVEDFDDHSVYQSAAIIRALLKHEPIVMLCDAMDINDEDRLNWLEILLRELTDNSNFFVVLASISALTFENERSLMRKLTAIPLLPFDHASCEAYFNATGNQIEPEIRTIIFTWTRGYPLALNIMTQAVMVGLDPRKDQDQKEIITRLTDQVLNQNVLVRVDPTERTWYLAILSLLSIPRHANLVMMQNLIEQFIPQLARENSLAYFDLRREINKVTEVLHWNTIGAGFSIDAPVRAIFLLKLRIEQPEMYYLAHRFLAQTNRQWADEVSGADLVRYLREYLYHSVSSEQSTTLTQFLTTAVQEITERFPASLTDLIEEIAQDNELKELLGDHFHNVESLMQNNIIMHTDYLAEG